MADARQIREHLHVHSSDGEHVGTVDHLQGDQIKLAKQDKASGGQHHFIPLSWVASVDDDQVRLSKSADEVRQQWKTSATT
jgi:hypothetical protein